MKNVKILFAGTVVISLFIASFIVNQGSVNAAEKQSDKCYIINLHGDIGSDAVSIEPQHLKVSVGSCVVWMNWVRAPEISISFKEGKTCANNTASPVGYSLVPDNSCYVTDFLTEGQTSSLKFMQPGDYNYNIYIKGRTTPLASGKITAK